VPAAPVAPSTPAAPAPTPAAAPAAGPVARAGDDEVIPFDNMRRRTAEHMVRSKHTSPHVLTAVEVDFHGVDRARSAHRSEWKEKEGFALTYLPFVARAVCDALAEFPNINASVGEDQLTVHHYVNLGIAVDLDRRGLIVPVIKSAEGKRLRQLSREIRDLAERARNKKLTPDDVTGGTFTITNPGPYGTLISAPIINQPQVAILSTDGVKKKPVVVETPAGDSIAIHPVGMVAMSWDHRAIDGAYASKFLHTIRTIIETRDWEAELA
jgi:2-oxoglutarate dehydrogenase E2 component (dihydrolipoamide succinyltransferase)